MSVTEPRSVTERVKEAVEESKPVLATLTEISFFGRTLREFGQRLRDLLRKDLIAKTRGVQEVQSSTLKGTEEGIEETHIAETAIQEKSQIKDQRGGRGSLK